MIAPARESPAAEVGAPAHVSRAARYVVFAATGVALLLRFYRLGAQSLWVDEAATYLSSTGSPWWVLTQQQYDGSVPPLYFLLVNTALRFGDSEAWLRAVSAIAGTASIPLFFVVARRWIGAAAAATGALLFAVAPFAVWYSQEARAYATLMLLGLGVVWAAQRALARPDAWRPRAAFALLLVVSFYCHSVALALVPFAAVLVALHEPPARWVRWAGAFAVAGLLILPGFLRYFTIYHYPTNHTDGSFDPSVLGFTLWAFGAGYSLGPSVAEFHQGAPARVALAAAGLIAPVLAAWVGLLALGARAVWRRSPRALLAIVALGVIPVAFAAAGSVSARYPYNVRYAVVAFPAFLMLLASGVCAVRPAWARAGVAGAVCVVSAVSLRNYYGDPRYAREDNRGASAFMTRVGVVGTDPIIVSASYTSTVFDYYLRRRPRHVAPFPGEELHGDTLAMARAAARLIGDHRRVWLFLSRADYRDEARDEARILRRYADACFVPDSSYRGLGVEAIRYVRPAVRRAALAEPPLPNAACDTPR